MSEPPSASESEAVQAAVAELRLRADRADERALVSEGRADMARERADQLEDRVDVHQHLITELQHEGLLAREHAEHLEQALRSARLIGSAVGMVMADRKVSEDVAFKTLTRASQNTNVKLRLVAEAIVRTGDVGLLPFL
ncbi:ANTAR domain-containing protein [Knoellia sp. CPCC 206435]|uniref:ANTAR domain-containing protein n=1 Tax=Knoellia terrae TaxID=3404797 RepID=UPI003B431E93